MERQKGGDACLPQLAFVYRDRAEKERQFRAGRRRAYRRRRGRRRFFSPGQGAMRSRRPMMAALSGPEATEDEDVEAMAAGWLALPFLPWPLRWLESVVELDELVGSLTGGTVTLVVVTGTGSVVVVVSGCVGVVLSDGPAVVVVVSGGDGPVASGGGGGTGVGASVGEHGPAGL